MRARNFTAAELPELMAYLHRCGVKGYLSFNILVFDDELAEAERLLRVAIRAGVDADETAGALDKALGFIKQEVGRERILRTMPELIFLPDESWERAARLEKLFQAAREEQD